MNEIIRRERQPRGTTRQADGETIGIDLGDKISQYCVLSFEGEVIEEGSFRNQEASLKKHFQNLPRARIALETGSQSAWISRLLSEYGHELIVANARDLRAISHSDRKNDRNDAEKLARYARIDPSVLNPITHRSEQQQADLDVVRARDALVRARTLLVNAARGLAKGHGQRLPKSLTATFGQRSAELLSGTLAAVGPLLEQIDLLSMQIEACEKLIKKIAETCYPETAFLRSVSGVGAVTSLTYVLTIADPERFAHSRDAGAYVGLQPKQRQSGEKDPQLGITKGGNRYLRKLLVQCANRILGPFGCDSHLRQWGLKLAERGGAKAKRRAIVAVARKLAVLLHRLWVTRTYYQPFFAPPAALGAAPAQMNAAG